ncbi:MAG: GspE/PulE family protein [Verrucomicrobiota bacterium]|nr:GspE/PulE family protein [Verrucomicrobiota bacterium]
MTQLLQRLVDGRSLSALDAERLAALPTSESQANLSSEGTALQWLAKEYGLEFTSLEATEIDKDVVSLFPARILIKEQLLPLRQSAEGVEVATSRLFDPQGLESLKALSGLNIKPVLATSESIQREIKGRLGVGADTIDTLKDDAAFQVIDEGDLEETDLDQAAGDASIIRFVNQVLSDAIEMRATDIHLEPFENELQIRYRVDGLLLDVPVPVEIKRFQPAIVSRIKILSHLDIAEKRLPQDGRIKLRVKRTEVDVRVSIIPMLHGEAVVMRLLKQDNTVLSLDNLGMAEKERGIFRKILGIPHGIFLVTGPTGSGKTTTLYTALSEINDKVRKIVTVEDPIEYQVRGINQIQVSEKTGLTFSVGLRSILRHDPDVVLVGEIRDQETARIAVQASLTGHLVFSTLHTNDAPSALTRLVDMGVEPYLVASSLEGVLAQRLVRVLCPSCKSEDHSDKAATLKETFNIPAGVPIFQPVGCGECRNTGFHGRHAVFEMMSLNQKVRQHILQNCSSGELKELAIKDGMTTLSEDGWRLVREGITTPDEVLRVTKSEHVNRD